MTSTLDPIGDMHDGHVNFVKKTFEQALNRSLKLGHNIVGMGDYIECGTKTSYGTFDQKDFATQQITRILDYFQPFADDNLLLGLLSGNHEDRILKQTGLDIVEIICKALGVPYFQRSHFFEWEGIKIFATHGAGAATTLTGRLRVFQKMKNICDADLYLCGHFHINFNYKEFIYTIEGAKNKFFCMTGSYLDYWKTYAHTKLLQPNKLGSPSIKIYNNNRMEFKEL